jgi:hypothetical protein
MIYPTTTKRATHPRAELRRLLEDNRAEQQAEAGEVRKAIIGLALIALALVGAYVVMFVLG